MLKLPLLLASVLSVNLLAGCSSNPKQSAIAEPYCYTNETIQRDNGIVNSKTVVECSDNPIKRAKLVGVDEKNCRRWERRDTFRGREKYYNGYICQDENGNWRPLSDY